MDDDDIDSCAIETMKQESNRDSGTHKLLSLNSGLEIDICGESIIDLPESIKITPFDLHSPIGICYSHVTVRSSDDDDG